VALLGCPQFLDDEFSVTPLEAAGADAGIYAGGGIAGILQSNGGASPGGGDGGAVPAGGAGGVAGGGNDAGGNGSGGSAGNTGFGGSGLGGDAGDGSGGDGGSGNGGDGNGGDGGAGNGGSSAGPGAVLAASLLHRYRFDTAGSVAVDSVGSAHGSVVGAQIAAGSGRVNLSPADSPSVRQFVDLPNGLISDLSSVTLETWVDWLGDPGDAATLWQPVFDFGSNDEPTEGQTGYARTFLALVVRASTNTLAAWYSNDTYANRVEAAASQGVGPLPAAIDPDIGTHVAVVVDGDDNALSLYLEGALVARVDPQQALDLSLINDVNVWIGRPQAKGREVDGGGVVRRI
jgi:hypothetical protein